MARTLKVLLNVGIDDQEQYGIPDAKEDEVITVDDKQAHVMVNVLKLARDYDAEFEEQEAERIRAFDEEAIERDLAERERRAELEAAVLERRKLRSKKPIIRDATAKSTRRSVAATESEDDSATSPVQNDDAATAIDAISRMRSADKLHQIANYDTRSTVVEAAQAKLAEIEGQQL